MLNILFIGSLGDQSLVTLKGLLNSGHRVSVVAFAGSTLGLGDSPSSRRKFIPAMNADSPDSILNMAMANGISIETLYPGITDNEFRSYTPDVGIVSCYPHRLLEDLQRLPRFGCFNLHPSLLPKYRGPAPLFWQLWHGERHAGVTLHQIDNHLDAGSIIDQARVPIPDGISEAELGRLCASRGSALINKVLSDLEQGSLVSSPQNESQASYHGWPTKRSFRVSTDWSARRLSNFILGTSQRGGTYELRIGLRLFQIDSLVGISPCLMPHEDYSVEGGCLRFNCYDGCVTVRLAE